MPNYRVDFDAIGDGRYAGSLSLGEEPQSVRTNPVIQATAAAADGEFVFGYFSEAKAAAIRQTDTLAARLKEERANIRGLKDKDMRYEQEAMTLGDVGRQMQAEMPTPLPPVGGPAKAED